MQVAAVREDAVGQEVVRFEGPVPPGAAVRGRRDQGPGEGCLPSPTYPGRWDHPLPGDHLWAQLRLLLGDAGAEGTAFAHPVGLQGPEARGQEGMPTVTSFERLPLNSYLMLTPTLPTESLYFLPDIYRHLKFSYFACTYIAVPIHLFIQQTLDENPLCARTCSRRLSTQPSKNHRLSVKGLFRARLSSTEITPLPCEKRSFNR